MGKEGSVAPKERVNIVYKSDTASGDDTAPRKVSGSGLS